MLRALCESTADFAASKDVCRQTDPLGRLSDSLLSTEHATRVAHEGKKMVAIWRRTWTEEEDNRNIFPPLKGPLKGPLRKAFASSPSEVSLKVPKKPPSLECYDPVQVTLLEEQCIVVNEEDRVLGAASKKNCHLLENINKGLLHRAFSVFLFNTNGELLLQQRSDAKITFPGLFTNTCCSHPLYVPEELEESHALGVKVAAQRRMYTELGIEPAQISTKDIHYLTRILYKAPSDSDWGENEVDYILLIQKDVEVHPNANEVKAIKYVSKDNILPFIASLESQGEVITPWFKLVIENFLFNWWDNLHDLKKFEDHHQVHFLTPNK
ncbi:isopentenyl-diphosphate Delta-isomerase 1-like [Ornithodoros turicata]